MKRFLIAALVAGCSSAPEPAAPAAPARSEGVVYVGLPGGPALVRCERNGDWSVQGSGFGVTHWIVDAEKRKIEPQHGSLRQSLFRSTLPFPQTTWGGSSIEVTQLVFPAEGGFVARYHVMNHGDDPSSCRLFVGIPGARRDGRTLRLGSKAALVAAEEPVPSDEAALAFDFSIEPGASKFVHVTTASLGGRVSSEALEQASAAWERTFSGRLLSLPDPAATAAYHADLAGSILGIEGCAAAVARVHEMLVRKEGDALRLLAGAPAEWLLGTIAAQGLPTDFGTLSLQYEGAFNSRMIEIAGSCRPPGGFRLEVPPVLRAIVDGQPGRVVDGVLHAPAGARRIEMPRRTD